MGCPVRAAGEEFGVSRIGIFQFLFQFPEQCIAPLFQFFNCLVQQVISQDELRIVPVHQLPRGFPVYPKGFETLVVVTDESYYRGFLFFGRLLVKNVLKMWEDLFLSNLLRQAGEKSVEDRHIGLQAGQQVFYFRDEVLIFF